MQGALCVLGQCCIGSLAPQHPCPLSAPDMLQSCAGAAMDLGPLQGGVWTPSCSSLHPPSRLQLPRGRCTHVQLQLLTATRPVVDLHTDGQLYRTSRPLSLLWAILVAAAAKPKPPGCGASPFQGALPSGPGPPTQGFFSIKIHMVLSFLFLMIFLTFSFLQLTLL